jgi:hypothetical protein
MGMGGIVGGNRSIPQNMGMIDALQLRYAAIEPSGVAPGHNPAYGSVGNDGKWPGKRR